MSCVSRLTPPTVSKYEQGIEADVWSFSVPLSQILYLVRPLVFQGILTIDVSGFQNQTNVTLVTYTNHTGVFDSIELIGYRPVGCERYTAVPSYGPSERKKKKRWREQHRNWAFCRCYKFWGTSSARSQWLQEGISVGKKEEKEGEKEGE